MQKMQGKHMKIVHMYVGRGRFPCIIMIIIYRMFYEKNIARPRNWYMYTNVPKNVNFSFFPIHFMKKNQDLYLKGLLLLFWSDIEGIYIDEKYRFNLHFLTYIDIVLWQLICKTDISNTNEDIFKCSTIYLLQYTSRKILL